ncbi:hypothetical protein [Clostridium sp.]|uniref:hypothetical protein n=1 Tax=Clostridium sp. TaxID=1506 RepID=UPI002632D9F8|nr:hypothetical protein [Clostridium sp.]
MRHQKKEVLKKQDILIAEAVIKGLIKKGEIKEAIKICERKNISSERFGELGKIVTEEMGL